jgi:hypothetical protein
MLNAPRAVDHLPLLEHNGTEILPIVHHGFSSPKKLIDNGFATQEQGDA